MDDHFLLDLYMQQSEDFRSLYSFSEFCFAVWLYRRAFFALKKVLFEYSCVDQTAHELRHIHS